MYSKVLVCKVCFRRVLNEQLCMSFGDLTDQCIYCILDHYDKKTHRDEDQQEEFKTALDLSKHFYAELGTLYEAALRDNEAKAKEIHALRGELAVLSAGAKFKHDLRNLIE